MERFGIPATARASFSIYNTEEDKVIGHKIVSCGTVIEYNGKFVTISYNTSIVKMVIIENLL